MAQRIGVEDFHSADLQRDDVIEAINDYGLQTPMFSAKAAGCEKKAFLLYEGDEDVEGKTTNRGRECTDNTDTGRSAAVSSYTSFTLSPAPASSAIRGLMVDLARQADPSQLSRLSDETLLSRFGSAPELSSTPNSVFHLTTSLSAFKTELARLVEQDYCITSLTTPLDTSASSKFQWGTYTIPQSKAKRAAPAPEKPLADFRTAVQSESTTDFVQFASNSSNSSSTPLRGILPACFTSQAACESTTRNCTGHGSCSKAYRDPDSGSNGLDCYSCKCQSTKSKNGKKTTVWAGPACQKKDVSVEFWLIALFTIAMMGLVGFAVGSVWEMGSEELPSVIGAGVSGPTARK
jgi:hypothetical protein